MNIDFTILKKSIGKELKFNADYLIEGKDFLDRFYAILRKVEDDFIVVEQRFIETDENDNDRLITFTRKLFKNMFIIDNETPING